MTGILKLKNKIKFSQEIKMVLSEIVIFALGFLLMDVRFIFGTYPFGLALVASQRKYTPFAFCGCLLAVVFKMDLAIEYLIVLGAILGLRIVGSLIQKKEKGNKIILGDITGNTFISNLFCESSDVRVAICALCAFGLGLFRVIYNNYAYYEIFVLVFFTILCGLLTYVFSLNKSREISIAYGAIAFAVMFAIKDFELFSLNVSIILSYALVLYASKHLGGVKGGVLGLLLGLCQGVTFAPVFGIGGVVAGLLWGVSPYLATMSAFAIAIGYGVYAGGYEALISLAPEMLFVSLIMYPLIKFKMIPVPEFIKENARGRKSVDGLILENKEANDKAYLSTLTEAFEGISQYLRELDEKYKTPTREDYTALCLEACEKHCYGCPKHEICWDRDIKTTDGNIARLGNELFEKGRVVKYVVEEKFLHRCPNIDLIVSKINEQSKEKLINVVKNNKLEVASYDYEQIAKLLFATQNQQSREELTDDKLSERLSRMCAKIGFECDEIKAIGIKSKRIIATGVDVDRTKCSMKELREELQRVVGLPISEPEFVMQNNYATMYASSENCFSTREHYDSFTKDGESINGDSVAFFEGAGGKKYMLLCDGMGSGKEASLTSNICVAFLERLLKVTNEKETALAMLNSIIRARGLECSSTIDLLEVDLVTGKGSFVKSGAVSSYIKRGGNVFKLDSKTMPIGIMKELDAEQISFELREGDICVMVSDGVVENKEDSSQIMKLLKAMENETLATMPNKILREMKKASKRSDDMTVCVMEIKVA